MHAPLLKSLRRKRPTTSVSVFTNQEKSEEDFHFYGKRQNVQVRVQPRFCCEHPRRRGAPRVARPELPRQAPSPGTALSTSASSCQSFARCLCASGLCLGLFHASVSKMCAKVSEKPGRRDFSDLGRLTMFPMKINGSSFFAFRHFGLGKFP